MRSFPFGLRDPIVTQRHKDVWDKRVVGTKSSSIGRNLSKGPKKTGEKHSKRKSRHAMHGYVGHSFSNVVSQVEWLTSRETI